MSKKDVKVMIFSDLEKIEGFLDVMESLGIRNDEDLSPEDREKFVNFWNDINQALHNIIDIKDKEIQDKLR